MYLAILLKGWQKTLGSQKSPLEASEGIPKVQDVVIR